jgi:hypothetical protein
MIYTRTEACTKPREASCIVGYAAILGMLWLGSDHGLKTNA